MSIEKTVGNVFEDLGFDREEAANLSIRAQLMSELVDYIKREEITQAVASERFGIPRPRVSDLTRGLIEKFTIDKLVNMLARIGLDTKVQVKRSRARLSVIDGGAKTTRARARKKAGAPRRRSA